MRDKPETEGDTPKSIIMKAYRDNADRAELVETLKNFPYTFGSSMPYPIEHYARGTWDEVILMFALSTAHENSPVFLSEDEFKEISKAVER